MSKLSVYYQLLQVNFWYQEYFHGVNLSSLRSAALTEYFRQPIVDTFDVNICTAKTQRYVIDFQAAHETDLHRIEIPLEFHMLQVTSAVLLRQLKLLYINSQKFPRRGQCTGSPSGSTWPSSGPTTRCGSARPPPSPSHIGTR